MPFELPGVHIAPNIQGDPELYETENRALDREGAILDAMRRVRDWTDGVVVDLGAGTGFWSVPLAEDAAHVFAVEPHGPSRVRAMRRFADAELDRASVLIGAAERIPLPDDSVDVVHVRFAALWGPGGEAGVAEILRVLEPGGAAFVIDNDLEHGTFARWLAKLPRWKRDRDAIEAFWADQGFSATTVHTSWTFDRREDLEAVVHLELPEIADDILGDHEGLRVEYGVRLFHRTL
jgi:SAM-dependent methyltransferase